ncbi:hypothetical protein K438DRAFT_849646 [Mycena galopus ATCC 62051]|nr:hypothetical protein K438DRAFT_849646 [Mycena galopus ATCC 62051]
MSRPLRSSRRFGGISGRPVGNGLDGHSKFSSMKAVLNEFFELYFPCASSTNPQSRILEVRGFTGARMGCALHIDYCFLRAGEILLHDNRWLSSSVIQWPAEIVAWT